MFKLKASGTVSLGLFGVLRDLILDS